MTNRLETTMINNMNAKPNHETTSRYHAQPGGNRLRGCAALAVLFTFGAPGARAEDPQVTITGGVRSGNPQFYDWKITNTHSAPIVFIHFPHYHGDNFEAPEDWNQEWENRAILGSKNAPGWCRASVEQPSAGIQPGGTVEFSMRVNRAGAIPRPGRVIVRFADQSEVVLDNVEVPSAKSFLERNIMMFAMAAIFIIALLVHAARSKAAKKQRLATPDQAGDPPEPAGA